MYIPRDNPRDEVNTMYQKFLTTGELTANNPGAPSTDLTIKTKTGRVYQVSYAQIDSLTRTQGSRVTVKGKDCNASLWISASGKALCFNDPTTGLAFISLPALLKVARNGGKGYLVSPPEKEAPVKVEPVKTTTNKKYGWEAMDLPPRDNTHPTRKVEPC